MRLEKCLEGYWGVQSKTLKCVCVHRTQHLIWDANASVRREVWRSVEAWWHFDNWWQLITGRFLHEEEVNEFVWVGAAGQCLHCIITCPFSFGAAFLLDSNQWGERVPFLKMCLCLFLASFCVVLKRKWKCILYLFIYSLICELSIANFTKEIFICMTLFCVKSKKHNQTLITFLTSHTP